MLHVDFLLLIARERRVEPGQDAVGLHFLELFAVQKIFFLPLIAEEEPVRALGSGGNAFLQKSAVRRDAGARADHDNRRVPVLGQPESLGDVKKDRHDGSHCDAFSEVGGANAFAQSAFAFVANGRHGEVHVLGMGLRARRNGVKARRELAQSLHKFLRREARGRVLLQQIDEMQPVEIMLQRLFLIRREQVPQKWRGITGLFHQCVQELRRWFGDRVIFPQRFAQPLGLALAAWDELVARATQRVQDLLHQVQTIAFHDTDGIARFIGQAGVCQREFVVARVIGGIWAREAAIHQQFCRVRIFARPRCSFSRHIS